MCLEHAPTTTGRIMTKPHSLTDAMIEDIAYETIYSDETVRTGGLGVPRYHDGQVMLRYADMRTAYDLGWKNAKKQDETYIREAYKQGFRDAKEQINEQINNLYKEES